MTPAIPAEKIQMVRSLLIEVPRLTVREIAARAGVSASSVCNIRKGYAKEPAVARPPAHPLPPKSHLTQTDDVSGNTWVISRDKTRIKSLGGQENTDAIICNAGFLCSIEERLSYPGHKESDL